MDSMNIVLNETLRPMSDNFGIAFHLGSLEVRWYGILSTLGYATAILIFCLVIAFKYKLKYEPAFYFIFPCLPMCLLGARFWSACIGDLDWSNFFKIGTGGLAIQGGVVFGLLIGVIYFPLVLKLPKYHVRVEVGDKVYVRQPSFFLYADAIIPTILIGQAIGRWGNFFNGEIFGKYVGPANQPNGLDWLKDLMPGVYNHMIAKQDIVIDNVHTLNYVFQPLFLYESFLGVCSFLFIYLVIANIYKIKAGVAAGSYFVAYGLIRYLMEPLRNVSFRFLGTYIMNGLLLVIGIVWIAFCQWIYPRLRKYYLDKSFKLYFHYLKNKKHNTVDEKKTLEAQQKVDEKIQKLNLKYEKISAKPVQYYEEKITKQCQLKSIKQKINELKNCVALDNKHENLTLNEFFKESKVHYIRKDSELIYFANR